jgi:hypothetical protein
LIGSVFRLISSSPWLDGDAMVQAASRLIVDEAARSGVGFGQRRLRLAAARDGCWLGRSWIVSASADGCLSRFAAASSWRTRPGGVLPLLSSASPFSLTGTGAAFSARRLLDDTRGFL